MGTLKTRDIRRNLQKKGFVEKVDSDHIRLHFFSPEGKKTIVSTKISHGEDEIGNDLISKMSKQTRLSKTQFIKLVDCTLSKEAYYDIVKDMI